MKDLANIKTQLMDVLVTIVRRHAIIMTLLVLGVMIFTVFLVNSITTMPPDDAYRAEKESSAVKIKFDQATIDKIERLREGTQNKSLDLPGGRINPFVE